MPHFLFLGGAGGAMERLADECRARGAKATRASSVDAADVHAEAKPDAVIVSADISDASGRLWPLGGAAAVRDLRKASGEDLPIWVIAEDSNPYLHCAFGAAGADAVFFADAGMSAAAALMVEQTPRGRAAFEEWANS